MMTACPPRVSAPAEPGDVTGSASKLVTMGGA